MKTIFLFLFTMLSIGAKAQDLIVSAGGEKTVNGNQYNGSLLFETKKFWAAGAFYQAGINREPSEGRLRDPFYGLVLQAPLAQSERILFVAVLRTGLVNDRFVVVTPALETRISVTRKAGLSVGAGLRYGYPSLSARLFVKLF